MLLSVWEEVTFIQFVVMTMRYLRIHVRCHVRVERLHLLSIQLLSICVQFLDQCVQEAERLLRVGVSEVIAKQKSDMELFGIFILRDGCIEIIVPQEVQTRSSVSLQTHFVAGHLLGTPLSRVWVKYELERRSVS